MRIAIVMAFAAALMTSAAFGQTNGLNQIAGPRTAQAAPVVAAQPNQAPQLTDTEKIALSALSEQMQEIDKARQNILRHFQSIAEDVKRNHPGYQLNMQTGQLEPVSAPPVEHPTTKK